MAGYEALKNSVVSLIPDYQAARPEGLIQPPASDIFGDTAQKDGLWPAIQGLHTMISGFEGRTYPAALGVATVVAGATALAMAHRLSQNGDPGLITDQVATLLNTAGTLVVAGVWTKSAKPISTSGADDGTHLVLVSGPNGEDTQRLTDAQIAAVSNYPGYRVEVKD